MSTPVTQPQLRELLERFGIRAPIGRVEGGQIADIDGFVDGNDARSIAIVHGAKRAERVCPVDEDAAAEMVEEAFGSAARRDTSFERSIVHLVCRASRMYVEGGLDSFRLGAVHLHPSGYEIGRALAFRTAPLHLGHRKEAREGALHSSFPHIPGRR